MQSFAIQALAFVGMISILVLWRAVIAPAIVRTFGVPMKAAFWRADLKNQHLNFWQYVWGFGVIDFGLGMFLFTTMWGLYVLYPTSTHLHRGSYCLINLIVSLVTGFVFGLSTAPRAGQQHAGGPTDRT